MAVPTLDTTGKFRLKLEFNGSGQTWSETYLMAYSTFAANVPRANALARWRAAVLGRDIKLDYAVVIEKGAARTSRVAIDAPIKGTTGVKFDDVANSEISINVNTPGDGLQVRMEMSSDRHADRHIKGLLDSYINAKKYRSTDNPEDFVNFGDYTTPIAPGDNWATPKTNDIWVWNKTPAYTSAERANFVTYETALWRFFQAVFNYTTGYYEEVVDNVKTGNIIISNWDKFVYRYASSRTLTQRF